jgi:divalent metal cation (Fe/Co/Zn/Cd) transporter
MLGLVVALLGIAAAQYLDMPALDGAAAIAIGGILAVTAALLAFECKGLLIGEAAGPAVVRGIREIVGRQDGVKATNEVLTMHLGPADVLANLSLDFEDGLSADEVEQAVSVLERAIKAAYPEVTRIFIEAQSATGHAEAAHGQG